MYENTITLTPCANNDWEDILAIERAVFGSEGFDPYFIRMIPFLFGRTCTIARDRDRAIGYSLGAIEDRPPNEGWLLSVAVLRGYERRGLGRALSTRCVELLRGNGAKAIKLTVAPDNVAALRIYSRLGFREVGRRPDFYGPGKDRLLMLLRG
jgi:ribosomal protein S18 acetylase RimI-like enzyme